MLTNIIFSKDRPWQLSEYLRTRKKYITGIDSTFIIYKASTQETKNRYTKLFKRHPEIHALEENDLYSFADLLETSIKNSYEFILFGVDDVLFYKPVDLGFLVKTALKSQYNKAFSLILRLGLNINWCQPANSPSKLLESNYKIDHNLICYSNVYNQGDWNYPFEVSASVYRKGDIVDLLRLISDKEGKIGYSHPNRFEAAGALICQNLNFLNLATVQSCCSTITINRVQDIYQNSLAGQEVDLNTTNELFDSLQQFDDEWYGSQKFNQIHIGDFRLVQSC